MIVRIDDILENTRVRVLNFSKDVPLKEQKGCPSCDLGLKVICQLVGGDGQQIRYGLCEKCGYMGYIDRPSRKWMTDFYSQDWDKAFPKTIAEIKNGTILPGKGIKPGRYLAASLIEKIQVDKEKPVYEVGSGYGEVLKYFRDSGFKKLIGIENSKHRAESVSRVLGFNVLRGEFESNRIQQELARSAPIGLFFSHHVLEHTYNPAEIVEKISKFQEIGDYLILALPNAEGEHINYALLYLVHLHSFTKESLEVLLNKYGYEIIADNSPDNTNTIVAARKVDKPRPTMKLKNNYFARAIERIKNGLAVGSVKDDRASELYWAQDKEQDHAWLRPKSGYWLFKKWVALVKSRFLRRFDPFYIMLVSYENRVNTNEPFEIKFNGQIKFLVK